MENNKIHIEELIREIDAEKRKGPKLDADKIIRQANLEIERRELQKKRKRTGYIATASVLVVVICVSFTYVSLNYGGYADNFRQMFMRESGTDDVSQTDNIIDGENNGEYIQKIVTLDEVKNYFSSSIELPQYMPEDYEIEEITATYAFEEIIQVNINYINLDTLNKLTYEITPIQYKKTKMNLIDLEESTILKTTENDIEYIYTDNTKNTENVVNWNKNEIAYSIYGNEEGEELLKVALSINLEDYHED